MSPPYQTFESSRAVAFTLIELLVVVALIAILALIALVNFSCATIRAKVSRVMADLKVVSDAIELYYTDWNDYPPNDGRFNILPNEISTPVAYIQDSRTLVDPFTDKAVHPVWGNLVRFYTYHKIIRDAEAYWSAMASGSLPPNEAVDLPGFNPGAFKKYNDWRLLSMGPDQTYSDLGYVNPPRCPAPLLCADITYDPTNGCVSYGNIHRTKKSPVGAGIPPG